MSSATPGSGTPPDTGPTDEKLRAYVDANAGRYTDAAIAAELIKAGYAPDAIRAALADAAARGLAIRPVSRAVRTILAAYGITFAILSLGMLANSSNLGGHLMPDASGGIVLLAGSLAVAFVISLIWVASRRLFVIGAAVLLGLSGAVAISSVQGLVMLAVAIGVVVVALRTASSPGSRATETLGVLLVVPLLLLLVVGGICVASGLPIPRAA
jgi:hypothetical protein